MQTTLDDYATIADLQAGNIQIAIPAGTQTTAGGVKSSSALNAVTINNDATMTVNNLSISKIQNDEALTVILNGGSANTL